MGVISLAGREQDELCRVDFRPSSLQGSGDGAAPGVQDTTSESDSKDALLRFVRALARAAAIADYERQNRLTDASSDNESGNLRKV